MQQGQIVLHSSHHWTPAETCANTRINEVESPLSSSGKRSEACETNAIENFLQDNFALPTSLCQTSWIDGIVYRIPVSLKLRIA
ncbi:hypothetical protein DMN91_006079 [Ooceraea biroi]|uniref:Uncharacterized protein n=1 Tax=Ooceraea biroi TaxID=2015173 RepID=A0A3L8DNA1_OOCBI|nr:hypothetical protein DMN91_006079 [Ooceraea biroi]